MAGDCREPPGPMLAQIGTNDVHRHAQDRLEGVPRAHRVHANLFQRLSTGCLLRRFALLSATRDPLPVAAVDPSKEGNLKVCVSTDPIQVHEYLKWSAPLSPTHIFLHPS